MIPWLKKHFIPHSHNDHRPHFLRTENARAILLLVIALELLVFIVPTLTLISRVQRHTNLASVMPGVLAVLTNDERKLNNLPELTVSPLLTKAAELKAQDMAEKGYFAHTSPEGKTPWYWLNQVGYVYDYAGENLAINFSDSKDVTDAWMNSPTHRANIVKNAYREVGTGIATGMYQGRETVFVAQVYANPRGVTTKPVDTKPRTPVVKESALATAGKEKTDQSIVTTTVTAPAPEETTVLGESTNTAASESSIGSSSPREKLDDTQFQTPISAPTNFEKIASSPRHAVSVTLSVILAVVMLAVVLNVVIKTNIQHPDLITNGLAVTAVIVGILFANSYFGTKDLMISQGYDYSSSQTASVLDSVTDSMNQDIPVVIELI
jgi:hypothetical protein